MNSLCVLIGYPNDLLLDAICKQLADKGCRFQRLPPHELADLAVTQQHNTFRLGAESIDGIFFRCSPDSGFSANFEPDDRGFADTEIRALWLSALNIPGVYTPNRFDAAMWFGNNLLLRLRILLYDAGVPLAPLTFGNETGAEAALWLTNHDSRIQGSPRPDLQRYVGATLTPESAIHTLLCICGRTFVAGPDRLPPTHCASAAATALHKGGISLCEITLNEHDQVVGINPLPIVPDPWLEQSSILLAEEYHAHLHLWRAN